MKVKAAGATCCRHAGGRLSNLVKDVAKAAGHGWKLSIDAFNVFNRVNFKNFVGVQTSPFFGRRQFGNPARQLQFSMKFHF